MMRECICFRVWMFSHFERRFTHGWSSRSLYGGSEPGRKWRREGDSDSDTTIVSYRMAVIVSFFRLVSIAVVSLVSCYCSPCENHCHV